MQLDWLSFHCRYYKLKNDLWNEFDKYFCAYSAVDLQRAQERFQQHTKHTGMTVVIIIYGTIVLLLLVYICVSLSVCFLHLVLCCSWVSSTFHSCFTVVELSTSNPCSDPLYLPPFNTFEEFQDLPWLLCHRRVLAIIFIVLNGCVEKRQVANDDLLCHCIYILYAALNVKLTRKPVEVWTRRVENCMELYGSCGFS